jgi:mannose-1-phosphate guanylyltransferase
MVAKSAGAAVLIIAGGRGTRFWPESRGGRPKPLFSIDGKSSLLDATIERAASCTPIERVFVLVSADQAPAFRRALRGLIPSTNLIVEPEGKGTAIAIAYGAAIIGRRCGPETTVCVMPADHYIAPTAGFQRSIQAAVRLAASNPAIVVVGVKPTRAESGYGYQQVGHTVGGGFKVVRFVEKPAPSMARRMVRSGKFLWNAGMFVMRVATLVSELREHAPELAKALESLPDLRRDEFVKRYHSLHYDSFDRVVAEKSRSVLGVRAQFEWYDVGSWEGLWEALGGNNRNVISGNVVEIGSQGVLARGGKRLMVLIGVDDLVVVDTNEAILIARRSRSQDVRLVTDELIRRGLSRYS